MTQFSLLPDLFASLYKDLNPQQSEAMKLLHGRDNVFVTGGAGTGKSFLMQNYLKGTDRECVPVLASTGAAAVLIGGRTFHSFFGLGIMEGGASATIERAVKDRRVRSRLKKANAIVIDEISMIPGEVFAVAESIAAIAREDSAPWGGLKVLAVGDFAQLPPVNRFSRDKDWAFKNSAWEKTGFLTVVLSEMMRAREDLDFCETLADVRKGEVTQRVRKLMESCSETFDGEEFTGSILFAKKVDVDNLNHKKLAELSGEVCSFDTVYSGQDHFKKALSKNAPIPEKLQLKVGAFVMLRKNDPKQRWVNGSLGWIRKIEKDCLTVELLNGRSIEVGPASFTMLDAEGREVAAARNFPISLAWAVTIHKAQGATLDSAMVTLKNLWEPGQAYVALSRVRSAAGLKVSSWDERSIIADEEVKNFHERLLSNA